MIKNKFKRIECKTESEKFLTYLCDNTFLKLWVYPNVFKESGKEFCDCLVIFENNIFIFSIKEGLKYNGATQQIAWNRWKRANIEESINQLNGAERWIRRYPNKLYIDEKCTRQVPITFNIKNAKIFKFVVALGLEQDIGILYSDEKHNLENNIGVFQIPKSNICHFLDSVNLELILSELDTITDFLKFYEEKENTISKLNNFAYYGESTILALYMQNFNENIGEHSILPTNFHKDELFIKDNLWKCINTNPQYLNKKKEDKVSYIVDKLLNKSIFYEQRGEIIGNIDIQNGPSPIKEIAKESRFQRRIIGHTLVDMYNKHSTLNKNQRFARKLLKEDETEAYVFLITSITANDSDVETQRKQLRIMLNIACGSLKNKHPKLEKVIGLSIIPNEYNFSAGEDYILLNCKEWSENDIKYYDELNKNFHFWNKTNTPRIINFDEFPKLS